MQLHRWETIYSLPSEELTILTQNFNLKLQYNVKKSNEQKLLRLVNIL